MPVLLILASVVILAGVVGVAIGRGGEMAEFAGDYPPIETDDLLTAADVALLRPPAALWGYNTGVTDQALGLIAQVVTERDVEIAALRRQLDELRGTPEPVQPAPELAGPELAGPEVAGPELAGPELAGPELAGPGPSVADEADEAAAADAEPAGETGPDA